MAETKKLGILMKEAGLIDDFQLQTALAHQRNWGGKLGSILVELEFVKEEDVAKVIAQKLKIPYADLFNPEIPEAIVQLLKADVAKKYVVMPVKKEGTSLMIAMADPLDIKAIDDLRFIIGMNTKPAIAMTSEIQLAIRKYYDGEHVVRKPRTLLKDIAASLSSSGKMEIIHGSDLNMPKAEPTDPVDSVLSREETSQQEMIDGKIRLDALISLLIEKGLISREELVKMIYQKKLGL
jgi:type IV pilus assembly protein PilB